MADHLSDDEIVGLARIASASNNYSGGRWISAEFSRDDLIGFARAVLSSATSSVAVQEEGDAKDAARYREFFASGLPITFLGVEYRTKAELDAAIDAVMGDQP